DTIVLKVEQVGGAACHTGHRSCFYRKIENGELVEDGEKVFDPKEVYKS
ncbi:MAG TPA: phosphoribosyl-AMP cyclohydrolase, partial [Deltaproteobacteria bacterium]|nr:phosphoribosyl-AMP cyclohydrolase [Deltaproteobacteria bacterium]